MRLKLFHGWVIDFTGGDYALCKHICMILIIAGSDLDARISEIYVWSIEWCYVNVKMIMSVRIN